MDSKHSINMTHGSLFKSIIRFSIPLILTGILQICYNAADSIVIGRFAGSTSLAAVGSSSSLFALIVNLFIGLTTGTAVMMSVCFGAKDYERIEKTVHTSIAISIIFGVCVAIVGFLTFRPILSLMGTPEDVIDKATLYMNILATGIPALMIYNFGSAILRSIGDTKRPLYFLLISGIVNVIVNIILVVVFKMDVAGVAIATVLSQYISAALVILSLVKSTDIYRLSFKKLKIHKYELFQILKIGLPAGLQSSLFGISNTLIQSSINLFGSVAMAGSSVSSNIEGFLYTLTNSLNQAATTACGQNLGAKDYKRIKHSILYCALIVTVLSSSIALLIILFKNPVFGLFTSDSEVVNYATIRLYRMALPIAIGGLMDVFSGSLRGLRYSIAPTLVSVFGVCVFRVLWIMTVFQKFTSLQVLFSSYGVSWFLTAIAHLLCLIYAMKKTKKILPESV